MSSRGGEDGGRHETVAGPSGVPCPHLALGTVGKRPFISTGFVPKVGGEGGKISRIIKL